MNAEHALAVTYERLEPTVVGTCSCGWRTGRSTEAQAEHAWQHHKEALDGRHR
jgi:hypothetical protein